MKKRTGWKNKLTETELKHIKETTNHSTLKEFWNNRNQQINLSFVCWSCQRIAAKLTEHKNESPVKRQMIKIQVYGSDAQGGMTHAGIHEVSDLSNKELRRIQADWEAWREQYIKDNPGDYPLMHLKPTVTLYAHFSNDPNDKSISELDRTTAKNNPIITLDLKAEDLDTPEPEHDHNANGCKYLGFDLWDCGHIDNFDPAI